jgi:hypothetical protein
MQLSVVVVYVIAISLIVRAKGVIDIVFVVKVGLSNTVLVPVATVLVIVTGVIVTSVGCTRVVIDAEYYS